LSQNQLTTTKNIPTILFGFSLLVIVVYTILKPQSDGIDNTIHYGNIIQSLITLVQEPIISVFELIIVLFFVLAVVIMYVKIKEWRKN